MRIIGWVILIVAGISMSGLPWYGCWIVLILGVAGEVLAASQAQRREDELRREVSRLTTEVKHLK